MQATIRRYGVFPRWIGKARRARLSRFGQSVADLFEESAIMKKVLLAAALTAVCGVAAAQGYAGALIGMSKFDCPAPLTCADDTDTAFKIYGGYDMGSDVSIEVGYTNFGEIPVASGAISGTAKASALSVVAAMRFPLMTDLVGVGRLGLGYVDVKANASNGAVAAQAESSEINLYAGLGLEYALTSDIKIVGQFDLADNGDLYLFGVGAQVGF